MYGFILENNFVMACFDSDKRVINEVHCTIHLYSEMKYYSIPQTSIEANFKNACT